MLKLLILTALLSLSALPSFADPSPDEKRLYQESLDRMYTQPQYQQAQSSGAPLTDEQLLDQQRAQARAERDYAASLDYWGAVALDAKEAIVTTRTNATKDNVKGKFLGWFKPSPENDAKEGALENCKKAGGKDCQVILSYKNACVAVVYTGYPTGTDPIAMVKTGKSTQEALSNAMAACEALPNSKCAPWSSKLPPDCSGFELK